MFFGGGGFPFGDMGGPSRDRDEPVDNEEYYRVLGVPKDATTDQLKRAYKKAAIKAHPDKGGDLEEFKKLGEAYECLSNPEKRQIYDQYGIKGLEGHGPAGDPSDIFEMFFGGGGRRQPRGPPKGEDVEHKIEFTLADFYNGASRKLAINRNVICSDCEGKGGPVDAMETCKECGGRGMRVVIRRMGPIVSQQQSPCPTCRASGQIMPEAKRCKKCQGRCVVREKKTLEVHLDKGAPEGHRVTFANDADEMPDTVAGDVVIICTQSPHPIFTRKNCDLWMEKEITLQEALCGTAFWIEHLDGQRRFAQTQNVVKPDTIMELSGEGMPRHGDIFNRGNLYVRFLITFPTQLITNAGAAALKQHLPQPRLPIPKASNDDTVQFLKPVDPKVLHARQQRERDDDEDVGGGVQCRQA